MGDYEDDDEFLSFPYEYEQEDVDNLIKFDKSKEQILAGMDSAEKGLIENIYDEEAEYDETKQNIDELNNLYKGKFDVYASMDSNLRYMQDQYVNSKQSNKLQESNLEVVENELKQIKSKNDSIAQDKTNKIRQLQINSFYQQKYNAQIGVLKTISIISILVIAVSLVKRRGLIPDIIYGVVLGILLVLGICVVSYQLFDIFIRDKSKFEEYDTTIYASSNPSSMSGDSFIEFSGDDDSNSKCKSSS